MLDTPILGWLNDELGDDGIDQRIQELYDREIHNAWASLMETEGGRLIAWSILDKCHVFSTTYARSADTHFLEGERSVGLKVMKEHILPLGTANLAVIMEEAQDRIDRLRAVAEAQLEKEQIDET